MPLVAVDCSDNQVGRKRDDLFDVQIDVAPHSGFSSRIRRIRAKLGHPHHFVPQTQEVKNLGQAGGQGDNPLGRLVETDLPIQGILELCAGRKRCPEKQKGHN